MRLRRVVLLLAFCASFGWSSEPSMAGGGTSGGKLRNPPRFLRDCKREWATHCSKVQIGRGQLLACLLRNEESASATCRRVLDIEREFRLLVSQIPGCRLSMRALCGDEETRQEIVSCMHRRRLQLPGGCRAQFDGAFGRDRFCDPENPPIPI